MTRGVTKWRGEAAAWRNPTADGARCGRMTRGEFVRCAVGAVAMAVGMVVLIALVAAIIALSPDQLSGEGDWNEEQLARAQAD